MNIDTTRRMLAELELGAAAHQRDIATLKLLLRIAELGVSAEECGALALQLDDGNYQQTEAFLCSMSGAVQKMLRRWLLAACLTDLETQGETK